jgi:hypothetical protein
MRCNIFLINLRNLLLERRLHFFYIQVDIGMSCGIGSKAVCLVNKIAKATRVFTIYAFENQILRRNTKVKQVLFNCTKRLVCLKITFV